VDLFGTRFLYQPHNLGRCGAPHNGVIHHHNPLPFEHATHRRQLQLHPKISYFLRGLDEGPPHIVRPYQPLLKGNPSFCSVAKRSHHPGIRNRDHYVALDGALGGQYFPEFSPGLVHGPPEDNRVGKREVYVLEDALLWLRMSHEAEGLDSGVVHHHNLTRVHLSLVRRFDQIQRACLRGENHSAVASPSHHQRSEPEGVPHGHQLVLREEHQGVRALQILAGIHDSQ